MPEPEPEGDDVAALLDAAEEIVNSAAPDILSEFDRRRSAVASGSASGADPAPA